MGLDMYLTGRKTFSTTPNTGEQLDQDDYRIKSQEIELGYWRKHPDLHGFIVTTFANHVDDCQPVPLTSSDLKKIITAIAQDDLPNTEGFFFGQSYKSLEQRDADLNIFYKALKWLNEGAQLPEPKELSTEVGNTLQSIGLKVYEIDESSKFLQGKEFRTVYYQASW